MSLFENMLKSKYYQDLLNKLPDDEREAILIALREFVDTFEKHVIKPIENYTSK